MTTTRIRATEVEAASLRVARFLTPTPLIRSRSDARLLFKLETEQPTGSFKVRGALSNLTGSIDDPMAPLVTASAGNHGLGVAWAARVLKRPGLVTVIVPESAPARKVEKLRGYGVRLMVHGTTYEDASDEGRRLAQSTGARYVHAYDDPLTAAGQGTVAPEILDQLRAIGDEERVGADRAPDDGKRLAIVVPLGGGGLVTGAAVFLKATRPLIRVVAAQPSASAAFPASLAAGRPLLSFAAGETLADGLAGGIGELVFEHRDLIDETVIVDEPDIGGAIRDLWRDQGVRAEGAAAVAVAAARTWIRRNGGRAIAIVTGGNIDDGPFTAITREPSR